MKIFKNKIFWAIACCWLLVLPLVVYSQPESEPAESLYTVLTPTKEQKIINDNIVDHLKKRHYLKIRLDDRMSSNILHRFLDAYDEHMAQGDGEHHGEGN